MIQKKRKTLKDTTKMKIMFLILKIGIVIWKLKNLEVQDMRHIQRKRKEKYIPQRMDPSNSQDDKIYIQSTIIYIPTIISK